MSFTNLLDAVKHNSMFTHRYEGVCQCCGDLLEAEKLSSFKPLNTNLYIENGVETFYTVISVKSSCTIIFFNSTTSPH